MIPKVFRVQYRIVFCDVMRRILSSYLEQTSGSCGMAVLSAGISEGLCGFAVPHLQQVFLNFRVV